MSKPVPTPKYSIGDTVYFGTVERVAEKLTCPDCNDTREWTVRSPNGDEYPIACPRCVNSTTYDVPMLVKVVYKGVVDEYVVRGIRISAGMCEVDEIRYRCVDKTTGVERGFIEENYLYADAADARFQANERAEAQERNERQTSTRQILNQSYKLKFVDAKLNSTRRQIFESWYKYNQFVEDIQGVLAESLTLAEMRESVRSALAWEMDDRPPHPLSRLIAAAQIYLEKPAAREMLVEALEFFTKPDDK